MVAESIRLQPALQLLVAVLALAAISVVIVRFAGQHEGTRSIRYHRAAVRALGVHFTLDDDPTHGGPRTGFVPESTELPLLFARGFKLLDYVL